MNSVEQFPDEVTKELKRIKRRERLFSSSLVGVFVFLLTVGVLVQAYKVSFVNPELSPESDYFSSFNNNPASYINYSSTATEIDIKQETGYNFSEKEQCEVTGTSGSCCVTSDKESVNNKLGQLEQAALNRFRQEEQVEQNVTAKATDFGCHIQIDIFDTKGKVIRSYGYQGGPIYVIK